MVGTGLGYCPVASRDAYPSESQRVTLSEKSTTDICCNTYDWDVGALPKKNLRAVASYDLVITF
jgi:hypothetical protein